MPKITKFYLNKASYLVGDNQSLSLLVVDYKNNRFEYDGVGKQTIVKIAKNLLARKHNVNFADKIVKE